MKSRFPGSICLLCWLAVLAMPLRLAAGDQKSEPVRYAVVDLGTFGGPGTNSSAYDMNNAGWVAGAANLTAGGPQHAFLWYGRGPLIDVGTLGGPNSEAGGPNLRGEGAILSETAETDPNGEDFCGFGTHLQCLAAIWRNWRLTALPTLPGGHNAQAYGLNNFGQVVGFSETEVEDSTCATSIPGQVFRYKPVIWEPDGAIRKLRLPHGDTVGFAFGINDAGQAVGSSGVCSNTSLPPVFAGGAHAVLWEKDGSAFDLGGLKGGVSNVAGNINNRGEVAGTSQLADGTVHSFVWSKAKGIRDIGSLPGAVMTVAPCCNTINDSGEVVGFSFDATGNVTPFVWRDNTMSDLSTLISKDSPWQLLFAQSVNDAGEIVGQGLIGGESHAFLAIPCDRNHSFWNGCKE
jgi:probable HAF family extracellular repeat protein